MGFAAFAWGTLSDRYGTRIVVLAGSLLLGLGLVAASQAQSSGNSSLCFGVLIGIAAGSFYAPMVALASALDRQAPQPRGRAGLRRHGRRAGDGRAVRKHG